MNYNFNNTRRGIALLIHNEEFNPYSGYKNRPGDTGDYQRMCEIFRELGFVLHNHRNLTAEELWRAANEAASAREMHENADCFACVIASHGEEMELRKDGNVKVLEHVIIGTDGQAIRTRDIVELFDSDNCEELENKPKFFFIQACRTGKHTKLGMDQGHVIKIESTQLPEDGHKRQVDDIDSRHSEEEESDTRHASSAEVFLDTVRRFHQVSEVECPDDTLLMFASLSRNFAVRNSVNGGWLLTSLYSQLKDSIVSGNLWTTDFLDILQCVLQNMTTKNFRPGDTMSPLYLAFSPGCLTHKLTKDVIFSFK